jgi:hypothetical protein
MSSDDDDDSHVGADESDGSMANGGHGLLCSHEGVDQRAQRLVIPQSHGGMPTGDEDAIKVLHRHGRIDAGICHGRRPVRRLAAHPLLGGCPLCRAAKVMTGIRPGVQIGLVTKLVGKRQAPATGQQGVSGIVQLVQVEAHLVRHPIGEHHLPHGAGSLEKG